MNSLAHVRANYNFFDLFLFHQKYLVDHINAICLLHNHNETIFSCIDGNVQTRHLK